MKDIYQMGNLILHKIFLGNNNIAVLEKKKNVQTTTPPLRPPPPLAVRLFIQHDFFHGARGSGVGGGGEYMRACVKLRARLIKNSKHTHTNGIYFIISHIYIYLPRMSVYAFSKFVYINIQIFKNIQKNKKLRTIYRRHAL